MFAANLPVVIHYDYKAHPIQGDYIKECTEELNALFTEGWEEYKEKNVGKSRNLLVFLKRRKQE